MRTHVISETSKSAAARSAGKKPDDDQFLQRTVGNLAMAQLMRESEEEEDLEDDADPQPETETTDEDLAGDGPDPIPSRKKPHSSKKFSGRTGIFGGMRGKYRRIWTWNWGRGRVEQDPSRTTTRYETLKATDTQPLPITGDSQITAHGAAFYEGEPIAGMVELTNFEQQVTIVVPGPTPSLGATETSEVLSSTTQLAATLNFRFGDASDPARGPRAKIVVDMLDPGTGAWTEVHATDWLNTRSAWQTQSLNGASLLPNTTYRVRVFAEYWERTSFLPGYDWADGRTQVDYSFSITQREQRVFKITKEIPGKKTQVEKGKSFHIKL